MKLADQMQALANENANVVNRLKAKIEEKLTEEAQLGATETFFKLRKGVNEDIISEITGWLTAEGFAVHKSNEDILISWWGGW